ncbi:hypothetical protein [Cupriavidus pampae]|uniref:Uncharacterized protein n=1 Tax=Cupriavidus pampae TaxID=659251 RepID=A0ABN7YQU3_9BURK|nr:hypothetical protein [Cupriavidus pampae]CAG9174706.1 hypothetical protein LMG32289_03125 [Cupriavidus pampae]
MRFHPEHHFKDWTARLHWPHWDHGRTSARHSSFSRPNWADEDAEIAKATLYVSTVTLVVLLVVLAGIAFGQEAMHWLGVQ